MWRNCWFVRNLSDGLVFPGLGYYFGPSLPDRMLMLLCQSNQVNFAEKSKFKIKSISQSSSEQRVGLTNITVDLLVSLIFQDEASQFSW